jgi:hypothetical protein
MRLGVINLVGLILAGGGDGPIPGGVVPDVMSLEPIVP